MKIVIFNLGCKVNQYDSDVISGLLIKAGHSVSNELEPADIYIIDTCAVTAEAERKSRQAIGRALKLNPKAEVYVCGCASQHSPDSFIKKGVKYIGGVAKKDLIADLTAQGVNVCAIPKEYEENGFAHSTRTRSYIKVQDGCNNFCSYCLIPYLRGRSRSRSLEQVVKESAEALNISKEIVLTGINLSAYGFDIGLTLTDLIDAFKDVNIRIRLGSLEANVIDEKLLTAMKNLKKFCPHFHLSLQSGDDEILKKMNRHYTTAEYMDKVKLIRRFYPDAAVTTDIIAGYPGESDSAHKNTLEFAKAVCFADIHAFAYSSREGTAAAKLKQVADDIKLNRARELGELKDELQKQYISRFIGRPLEVLFEEDGSGESSGYSKNYIRIYTDKKYVNEIKIITPEVLYRDGLKG